MMKSLTLNEILAAFGDTDERHERILATEFAKHDFAYRRLSQDERDDVILRLLRKLGELSEVGEHRHEIWESCWAEAASNYNASQSRLEALDPAFMGATPIIRLLGDFAQTISPGFETALFNVYRRWIFESFIDHHYSRVYEFGCGSGFNLAALASLRPDLSLTGLDWAQSAVDLANKIGSDHKMNITGRRFDFFAPDASLELGRGSVAMTFAALEQTGRRCRTFVDWILAKKPDLVISMEPIEEFYNSECLYDNLALQYHTIRKYLSGYYQYIAELEAAGKAKIIRQHRPEIGNLYAESYSLIIWKPL